MNTFIIFVILIIAVGFLENILLHPKYFDSDEYHRDIESDVPVIIIAEKLRKHKYDKRK